MADGATCSVGTDCRASGSCLAGVCVAGAAASDGTACTADDPCSGHSACSGSVCRGQRSGTVLLAARGRHASLSGLDGADVQARLLIGAQCFVAELTGQCRLDAKTLRCRSGR
jgi:hypothetical protein